MLIYIPLALIAVAYLAYWYSTRTFNYWKVRNVATPPTVPLFGHLKDVSFRKQFTGAAYEQIYKQFPKEKIVGLYRMTTPSVLIRDLDLVKQIMIKDFNLFAGRGIEFSDEGLGANLFHANTNTWRVLRPRFTPIFTSGKLKNMFPLISERADGIFTHLDFNKPGEYDILSIAKLYTISTITACAFGLDLDAHDPKLKALKALDNLILEPTLAVEFDLMFPGIMKKINKSLFPTEITDFFYDLVKTVFAQRNGKPSHRKDFMDLILELKQQTTIEGGKQQNDGSHLSVELTDSLIAAQAFVFYVGGYETSSATLSFTMYELANNIKIQEKLISEIDAARDKNNGDIDYELAMELPYLSMVINETLRKYPVVDPIQRCAEVDYEIPGTGVTLKKGQIVIISPSGIHRDEKHYPDPEVFDPERFSHENSKDRHPCAFIPFGIGPRNCIGSRFAKLQSQLFLAKFFSNFRVEPSINTPKILKIEPKRIVLGPLNNEMHVNVIPRRLK